MLPYRVIGSNVGFKAGRHNMKCVTGKLVGQDRLRPSGSPLFMQEAQREPGAVVQMGQGCCGWPAWLRWR